MMNKIIDKLSKETDSPVDCGSISSSTQQQQLSSEENRNPTTSRMDTTDTTNSSEISTSAALQITDPANNPRALKILFLSSDTGGGHRASATSLAQQFQNLFPGSVFELCDIVQLDAPPPYNSLVRTYKHLSAHPQQWKFVYSVSNTRAYEMLADVHMKSAMERSVRKRIQSYNPDVVVSVHPLMTNVPVLACRNITKETGKHLPIFTVCTDLGSAHSMWFANGVERLFVASEAIKSLAMQRGKVKEEKILISGLPIRYDFAVQAEKMGERHSSEGRLYQRSVRKELGLVSYKDRKTVLVMGGGEGCGRLSNIVDALYLQFVERGMEALILVVCGRNEKLKESLKKRDWEALREKFQLARTSGADFESCIGILSDVGCINPGGGVASHLRRIISTPSMLGISQSSGGLAGLVNTPTDPFTPSPKGKTVMYEDNNGMATSLPGSRSTSPEPAEDTNVEVVTKSCAQRNNLYDLNSLLHPLESHDDDEENERGVTEVSTPELKSAVIDESLVGSGPPLQTHSQESSNSLLDSTVKVIGLGFITQMAEYMVAADVLVSKAGPGTIAEAAAVSLPVMLTSFLPGQEEGNVDFVIDGKFGAFVSDSDPQGISDVVAGWLLDETKLNELSDNAKACGAPDAAADIVEAIGESALRWKHHNEEEIELISEEIKVTS